MRPVIHVLGVLFLAQLVFVGLVHALLRAQGKDSHETIESLHALPVLGGWFLPDEETKPAAKTEQELRREWAEQALRRGREFFPLPAGFDREELAGVLAATRKRHDELKEREARIHEEEEAVRASRKALEEQRDEILAAARRLDSQARELESAREALTSERGFMDEDLRRRLRGIAPIYAGMEPARAAEQLAGLAPDVAAQLLLLMEVRRSSRVLAAMPTPVAVVLTKRMQALGLSRQAPGSDTVQGK